MNRDETINILTILKVAYPNGYKNLTKQDAEATIALWLDIFADKPFEIVAMAAKSYICTGIFPPAIAEINEYINKFTHPEQMTGLEAWQYVRKACSNSGYHAKEEFDRLPPVIQRTVGSPNQLKAWCMEEIEIFETVTQSNFIKSFSARQKSMAEFDKLPEVIKITALKLSGLLPQIPQVDTDDRLKKLTHIATRGAV